MCINSSLYLFICLCSNSKVMNECVWIFYVIRKEWLNFGKSPDYTQKSLVFSKVPFAIIFQWLWLALLKKDGASLHEIFMWMRLVKKRSDYILKKIRIIFWTPKKSKFLEPHTTPPPPHPPQRLILHCTSDVEFYIWTDFVYFLAISFILKRPSVYSYHDVDKTTCFRESLGLKK